MGLSKDNHLEDIFAKTIEEDHSDEVIAVVEYEVYKPVVRQVESVYLHIFQQSLLFFKYKAIHEYW